MNSNPCCRFRHVCRESTNLQVQSPPYARHGSCNTVLRYSNMLHLHQRVCHRVGDPMVRTSRFTASIHAFFVMLSLSSFVSWQTSCPISIGFCPSKFRRTHWVSIKHDLRNKALGFSKRSLGEPVCSCVGFSQAERTPNEETSRVSSHVPLSKSRGELWAFDIARGFFFRDYGSDVTGMPTAPLNEALQFARQILARKTCRRFELIQRDAAPAHVG